MQRQCVGYWTEDSYQVILSNIKWQNIQAKEQSTVGIFALLSCVKLMWCLHWMHDNSKFNVTPQEISSAFSRQEPLTNYYCMWPNQTVSELPCLHKCFVKCMISCLKPDDIISQYPGWEWPQARNDIRTIMTADLTFQNPLRIILHRTDSFSYRIHSFRIHNYKQGRVSNVNLRKRKP